MACSLCLHVLEEDTLSNTDTNEVSTQLSKIFPNVDVSVLDQPLYCKTCVTALEKFLNFKHICNDIEEKLVEIRNSIDLDNEHDYTRSTVLNLKDIVKDENQPDNIKNENLLNCRLCLQTTETDNCIELTEGCPHRKVLALCLPEINLNITYDPQSCKDCTDTIEELHYFNQYYLNIQNKLHEFNITLKEALENSETLSIIKESASVLVPIEEAYVSNDPDDILCAVTLDQKEGTIDVVPATNDDSLFSEDKAFNIKKEVDNGMVVDLKTTLDGSFFEEETIQKANLTKNILQKFEKWEEIEFYNCPDCSYKTVVEQFLIDHISQTHQQLVCNVKVYHCTKCDYEALNEKTLKRHFYNSHMPNRKFKPKIHQCPHCDFCTAAKHSLKLHVIRKHSVIDESNLFHCSVCDFKTTVKFSLNRHFKRRHVFIEKNHKCEICDYATRMEADLKDHIKRKHFREKIHCCPHCEYQSVMKQHVHLHIMRKHTADCDIDYFQCSICPYKTIVKQRLNEHFKRKHLELGVKLHTCECGFKTKLKKDMKFHKRTHFNHKQYIMDEDGIHDTVTFEYVEDYDELNDQEVQIQFVEGSAEDAEDFEEDGEEYNKTIIYNNEETQESINEDSQTIIYNSEETQESVNEDNQTIIYNSEETQESVNEEQNNEHNDIEDVMECHVIENKFVADEENETVEDCNNESNAQEIVNDDHE